MEETTSLRSPHIPSITLTNHSFTTHTPLSLSPYTVTHSLPYDTNDTFLFDTMTPVLSHTFNLTTHTLHWVSLQKYKQMVITLWVVMVKAVHVEINTNNNMDLTKLFKE